MKISVVLVMVGVRQARACLPGCVVLSLRLVRFRGRRNREVYCCGLGDCLVIIDEVVYNIPITIVVVMVFDWVCVSFDKLI